MRSIYAYILILGLLGNETLLCVFGFLVHLNLSVWVASIIYIITCCPFLALNCSLPSTRRSLIVPPPSLPLVLTTISKNSLCSNDLIRRNEWEPGGQLRKECWNGSPGRIYPWPPLRSWSALTNISKDDWFPREIVEICEWRKAWLREN